LRINFIGINDLAAYCQDAKASRHSIEVQFFHAPKLHQLGKYIDESSTWTTFTRHEIDMQQIEKANSIRAMVEIPGTLTQSAKKSPELARDHESCRFCWRYRRIRAEWNIRPAMQLHPWRQTCIGTDAQAPRC
jgi:hypothetical protein